MLLPKGLSHFSRHRAWSGKGRHESGIRSAASWRRAAIVAQPGARRRHGGAAGAEEQAFNQTEDQMLNSEFAIGA
jgi:hypothetical protein